jgi:hypothetical protein
MHEQRVVQQRVLGSDGEQRGAQVFQISVQRRDIRNTPVHDGGKKGIVELLHIDCPEHEPGVAEQTLAGRHAEIEGAVHDVGSREPGVAVAVAHAQDGDSGQMSTCGFATNGQNVGDQARGAAPFGFRGSDALLGNW